MISGGWDDKVMCWDDRQPYATRYFEGVHICGEGLDFDKPGRQVRDLAKSQRYIELNKAVCVGANIPPVRFSIMVVISAETTNRQERYYSAQVCAQTQVYSFPFRNERTGVPYITSRRPNLRVATEKIFKEIIELNITGESNLSLSQQSRLRL